jgi:hypothetical protein
MAKKEMVIDVNDAVTLAQNEVVLKTYEGFNTSDPIGKGYFTITNYRFIFYSNSKDKEVSSISVNECPIECIGGIASEFGKRVKKVQKFFAILALLIGLTGLGLGVYGAVIFNQMYLLVGFIAGGLFLILSLILLLTCKRRIFSLEIMYRIPNNVMLSLVSDFFKSPNRNKIRIIPNSESVHMIKELGKTIVEAQNYKHN